MNSIWSLIDLMRLNPHWWSPIIFSAYAINLDGGTDKHCLSGLITLKTIIDEIPVFGDNV